MANVTVTGLREIEAAMDGLTVSSGKGVLRRAGLNALKPIAEAARAMAPDNPATGAPDLKSGISASPTLSKRQKGINRRLVKDTKASAEVYVGAGADPAAHSQEFGNVNHGAQPFMRPAWDGGKDQVLDDIKRELWSEIEKAAKRAARKAARQAR